MQYDLSIRQIVVAAIAWVAAAAMCLSASVYGQVVMLIWWPNAIAVGTLLLIPYRKWPIFLAVAGILGTIDNWYFGTGLFGAFAMAVANFSEAAVAAWLARKILADKPYSDLRLRDLFKLVGAAAAGAAVSTIIANLAQPVPMTWYSVAWWFSSVMLGTLVGTPLFLAAYEAIHHRRHLKETDRPSVRRPLPELLLTAALMFGLSYFVLIEERLPLLFLTMAFTIFAVVRSGVAGATVCVLALSVAGSIISFGGASPAAGIDLDRRLVGLVLQLYMMVLLCTSVPLAALLLAHDRLAARLRARNESMHESLTWLEMSEEIGRLGRWRYDIASSSLIWSRQTFLVCGFEPPAEGGGNPGDIGHLYPDGGKEFLELMAHHAQDRARYSFEFRIVTPRGEDRILKMHATNQFSESGEPIARIGVVMDVTEQHQRQEALDRERSRAMRLAAEAQFLAQTDPLTGLANRRRTMTQLEKFIDLCRDEGRSLALIAFDIDHFKLVNDRFGHQTGDDVLVKVADIARGQVRASDLIGRIGGEEFVWMLPDAGPVETGLAAERLRLAIETTSEGEGLPKVTASIGYSQWQAGDDASTLLARADTALYEAKGAGRNQVKNAA